MKSQLRYIPLKVLEQKILRDLVESSLKHWINFWEDTKVEINQKMIDKKRDDIETLLDMRNIEGEQHRCWKETKGYILKVNGIERDFYVRSVLNEKDLMKWLLKKRQVYETYGWIQHYILNNGIEHHKTLSKEELSEMDERDDSFWIRYFAYEYPNNYLRLKYRESDRDRDLRLRKKHKNVANKYGVDDPRAKRLYEEIMRN